MILVFFSNQKLYKDIIQTKSISKGASQNGISQSAASQHLQELERRLGVTLLDRSTRPFTVSSAGRSYYDLCRDVLRCEEEFLAALDEQRGRVEGEVRVASIYSIGLSEITRLREEFERRYPAATLHVDYLRPVRIYEALLTDQADLGLVSYPEASKDLSVIPWRKEEMVVCASPFHVLAQSAILLPSDLEGNDYIGFDPDLSIRRELDRFFRDQDVTLQIRMQFDNIQMVKEAVALGNGVSVLPARTFQSEIEQGRLVAIPLLAPQLYRPVGIVHRKRRRFNRAVQSFLELLMETPDSAVRAAAPALST